MGHWDRQWLEVAELLTDCSLGYDLHHHPKPEAVVTEAAVAGEKPSGTERRGLPVAAAQDTGGASGGPYGVIGGDCL